jgi:hypothetical protein
MVPANYKKDTYPDGREFVGVGIQPTRYRSKEFLADKTICIALIYLIRDLITEPTKQPTISL